MSAAFRHRIIHKIVEQKGTFTLPPGSKYMVRVDMVAEQIFVYQANEFSGFFALNFDVPVIQEDMTKVDKELLRHIPQSLENVYCWVW